METSEVDAPIEVVASFSGQGVKPCLFVWEKRRYHVARITASWTEVAGHYHRHHFALFTADGANLYEICFHPANLAWRLLRIEHD